MSRLKNDSRVLYRIMRRVILGFAVFLVFIVGVIAWRRLIVEAKAITDLAYGELVSIGIMFAIAAVLWLLAQRIDREMKG